MSLKYQCKRVRGEGYYLMEDGVKVPVRIFMNEQLFEEAEEDVFRQVKAATEFPGVTDVVLTPDAHTGYVVPIGCVMATDGTLCQAPVGYDIGCFRGDTLVPTADGKSTPIAELAHAGGEIYVYAITPDQRVEVARATAQKTRSAAPLVRVTLDHGRDIVCTPDHEFMLRDGCYREAKDLTPGTSLMPFYSRPDRDGRRAVAHPRDYAALRTPGSVALTAGRQTSGVQHAAGYNHQVVSVTPLAETADVYCLTVPGYGNFALEAGVFVHNCGMAALVSQVPAEKGFDERLRLKFSQEVMARVGMGTGKGSGYTVDEKRFNEIVRNGAKALGYNRNNSERDFIPVDDKWDIPDTPLRRGITQLGSLGGGNHFIELQHDQHNRLVVMIHTGSRGFGHGLATHFIDIGRQRLRKEKRLPGDAKVSAEAVYFEPNDKNWTGYKNAVAAGANFAIVNRLLIMQEVARSFRKVFGEEPELLYEISHNLAQLEPQPDGKQAWVHRKGATRAFPAGHAMLKGTRWEETGHPIIIPGSMGDKSYILYALPGAEKSLFSVNHGCGRRMSRSAARNQFSQSGVNRQMKELNVMVNAGGDVPIDESPGCYKDSSLVIDAVVSAKLARVEYELTPIASLKGKD